MRDPVKAAERKRRFLQRKKVEKYGPEWADVDMRGRHGNHARGEASGKWQGDRIVTSHGYVAVRVHPDYPHAWGAPGLVGFKYAYEHVTIMVAHIGRPLEPNEVVHHRNGKRDDNRLENLELTTRSDHAREHSDVPGARDAMGRFAPEKPRTPEDLRVQEFPEVAT